MITHLDAPRKVLFVIRGKLGDTLALYMAVRQYIDQFPNDSVTLLLRSCYADLLRKERGLRIISFGSRIEMIARLIWLRLRREAFDVLAVLWGFGPPIQLIAKMVSAKRKIYLDSRFSDLYPEWPSSNEVTALVEPALNVIHCFEPRLSQPYSLHLPSLIAMRSPGASAVGVVPIADELRRNFDESSLRVLLTEVIARHPGKPVLVFVNPTNKGAEAIINMQLPLGVELVEFSNLLDIVREYRFLAAWYGTDTGLYHLAAAMGVPAVVFFGPTQPSKIIFCKQPDVRWVRLNVLGSSHCEEKACTRPSCLHQAVSTFANEPVCISLESVPATCPLKRHSEKVITAITVHENTHHQA